MIIAPQKQEVESYNIGRTSQFKILADAMAFKSLSEGLYSNKVLAVVREYTSNAVDAQIAAGKATTPVKVHLPNRFEPFFSVRDEGTGLSEDDVMELYVTYFDSNKRSCELQSGGFGLGSKSAFAYTDSFTITSIFNGYKKVYSAYIDESGLPSMSKLAEEATLDPNGIEIKVPVHMKDMASFVENAQTIYEFYPVRPEVVGATLEYPTHNYKLTGTDWKFEKQHGTYVYAVVGSIAYQVSDNEVAFKTPFEGHYYINFNVNEVELTRSRESISFTDKTKKAIKDKFAKVSVEIDKIFQVEIEAQPNVLEAARFINSVRRLNNNDKFSFRGVEYQLDDMIKNGQETANKILGIDPKVGYSVEDYGISAFYFETIRGNRRNVILETNQYSVAHLVRAMVFTTGTINYLKAGKGRALKKRVRLYAEQNNLNRENNVFVIFSGKAQENIDKIAAAYQVDPKLIQDADVLIPQAPRGKRAPGSANAYKFLGNGQFRATKIAEIQDEEIYYALDTEENRAGLTEAAYIGLFEQTFKSVGVTFKNLSVYLIPKRNVPFFDTDNITELKPYLQELLIANEAKLRAKLVEQGVAHAAGRYAETHGALNVFKILGFNLNGHDMSAGLVQKFGNYSVSITDEIAKASKLEIEKMENALAAYPMLDEGCVKNHYAQSNVYTDKEVRHYIALYDAVRATGISVQF